MSLIKRLFGLDVASHFERAERYERAGKLGMAQLELERAMEIAGAADAEQRKQTRGHTRAVQPFGLSRTREVEVRDRM